jgi:TRAP-type C4-dicarboxylate transport system permease large subunit
MEWYEILGLLLAAIIFLMFVGVPVAFSFIAVNTVVAVMIFGRYGSFDDRVAAGIAQLSDNAFGNLAQFALVPIPMFLLMGEFFFRSGLALRMFEVIERLLDRIPARLSFVTVAGGTAFATLSGSSMASTAMLGRLLVPEMTKRGYKLKLSVGPILAVGGLAILIPPSALAVLLGTIAEIDIGRLLIAGIVPGLLLAVMFAVVILAMALLDPDAAPYYRVEPTPFAQKARLVVFELLPMTAIIAFVVLAILRGYATPSESAALGTLAVFVLAFVYGPLPRILAALVGGDDRRAELRQCLRDYGKALVLSLLGATRMTVIILFILFGASLFSNVLAGTRATTGLLDYVFSLSLSPAALAAVFLLIVILLGCFMDQLGIMLLTVPIFFPVIAGLDFAMDGSQTDIWFSVLMLIALEIGLVTPPFGLLLFVMMSVAPEGVGFRQVCLSALPFIACTLALLAIVFFVPGVATWLPFR